MADEASRAGDPYATSQILDWASTTHHPPDRALRDAFEAPKVHDMPEIQVGASEGRLLELLLRLAGARRVVEIGTLAGYSALWMIRALPSDGHLWTLEADPAHAAVARGVFREAGVQDRVTIIEGDARGALSKLSDSGPFCAVFLDADKAGYARYGRWATEHLREGGLLLGDNAYLFGRLLDEGDVPEAMRTFHQEMAEHYLSVCIPTPDGLALGIKTGADT